MTDSYSSHTVCHTLYNCLHLQGGVVDAEMYSIVKERDELKAALLDLEEHTEDVQNSVKALTAERDHLKVLFQQVSALFLQTCPTNPSETCKDQMILRI